MFWITLSKQPIRSCKIVQEDSSDDGYRSLSARGNSKTGAGTLSGFQSVQTRQKWLTSSSSWKIHRLNWLLNTLINLFLSSRGSLENEKKISRSKEIPNMTTARTIPIKIEATKTEIPKLSSTQFNSCYNIPGLDPYKVTLSWFLFILCFTLQPTGVKSLIQSFERKSSQPICNKSNYLFQRPRTCSLLMSQSFSEPSWNRWATPSI